MHIDVNNFQIMNKGTPDEAKWYPIEAIVEVVNAMRQKEWTYVKNTPCKSLEIKLDMKNGMCRIKDRTGKLLTIEEFMRQE